MDGGDPSMPTHKRLRLDSVNPGHHNGPLPPPTAQPARHSSIPNHPNHPNHQNHPIPAQVTSPSRHHYPPHSLPPPPSQPYSPNPGHHHYRQPPPPPPPPSSSTQPQPSQHPAPPPSSSSSLPPSDLRNLSDPTKVPHRVHGTPVISSPSAIPQDSISTYRPPPTPQYTSAPEVGPLSRTASVSEDKDSKPPMAHGGPPSPWQVTPDHRNGHSLSNGYPPAISPPIQNEQSSYHTPPLQPYGQQPPPHPAGSYNQPYMNQYAPGPGQMRRKQVRATQACNHCRSRKQKCDEARPCQFCRENNFDCQYKDVPVPKQDRSMMQLQESVNSISKLVAENSETLKIFLGNFNSWKQGVEARLPRQNEYSTAVDNPSPAQSYSARRNSLSEQHTAKAPTPMQPPAPYARMSSMKAESPGNMHSHTSPLAHVMTPVKQESGAPALQPPTPAESVDQSPDPGALDTDHATPAHKLLPEWAADYNLQQYVPALRKLVEGGKEIIDYPIHYEQERGLLRVWGVGEGHDSTDGVQGVASPGSQTEVDSPSPASITGKDLLWGHPPVDHSSPSTVNGDTLRRENVGLLADGKPDFRYKTLMDLVDSYTKHIHVLHPVLNLYQLEKMVDTFAKLYCPDYNTSGPGASAVPERLNPGLKRKRSSSMFGDGPFSAEEVSKIPIERSLRNAIVLLVLALGKVSEHKTSLPSPQGDRPLLDYSYSRESPYSANHSFRSEDSESRPRNIDILPGMIYYSYASDILGNQQGGNTVAHAQAMILASLYLAQYGRVLESWSWISNACRIALVLIQADYPRINRDRINRHGNGATQDPAEPELSPKERHRLNMVKIIYWTCLSLETDIRAEMSTLPSTKVSQYQSNIIYPAGVHEHFPEVKSTDSNDENLFIYTSLMHVRVLLNGAHISLYGGEGRKSNDVVTNSKHTAALLTQWRAVLPPLLTWRDEDPPSTDPNLARVRAKVHGAMYVVLRPCLFAAIQVCKEAPYNISYNDNSPASSGVSASTPVAYRSTSDLATQHADLFRVSTDCIRSAIQSTIAFDRIGADPDSPYENYVSTRTGRLILTNIVGTLHAQFGNMIVLAAVWKSPLMSYIPKDTLTFETLSRLFHRTMKILEEMAPNSPILKIDWDILNEIRGHLRLITY